MYANTNKFLYDLASHDEAIKLTQNEVAILKHLKDKDNYGAKIIEAFWDACEGKKYVSGGTIYPALNKLAEKGFLAKYEQDSDLDKRRGKNKFMYSITPKGRSALKVLDIFFARVEKYEEL
ncbi:hypothetical protein BJP34_35660 (plasmid) [Moorena producens PAL-8-15-08-1]|uniref:Transcription regulator PadR N-terminal domain-containing protein n=1 Tax=Moorena producens PAL-8-15-08-1 TaxID=1458985 RepID=A0A1D8U481_9CYAN|nr:PadR family transcriptional regulator [Moorena producens]AOX04719.1 hypothetical protein BJP34_35660 [Moorena producens PAL-8-15-08-1]